MSSKDSVTSEGEIFSSDSEKANRSLHSRNGNSVDRLSRPHYPYTTRSPASRSSYRRDSRSRSRSPYRASRGEKRQRDYEYISDRHGVDPRRFNVRYEDRYDNDRQRRSTYKDLDPPHTARSHLRYDDDRYHRKRPRTASRSRSRSPFRHTKARDSYGEGKDRRIRDELPLNSQDKRDRNVAEQPRSQQPVSERRPTGATQPSRSHNDSTKYESSKVFVDTNQSKNVRNQIADQYATAGTKLTGTNNTVRNTGGQVADTSPVKGSAYEHTVFDEVKEAEERRKRREALKAKYSNQPKPLLIQALQSSNQPTAELSDTHSNVESPANIESGMVSPQTPKEGSAPHSPAEFDFSKDDTFAQANTTPPSEADQEEPSAADYDPTIDMQEERARHDKRLFNEEISANEYDETQPEKREIVLPAEEPKPQKAKDEFDMFADEDMDEDNMFAPAPAKPAKVPAPEGKPAQTMNINMLDNWDDPEGYYNTILGELIEARYQVQQNLGRGMFSSVVRALDKDTQKLVAIKIVRNNDTMRKAGLKEIAVLRELENTDPEDKKHLIRLSRSFDHKGHLCMVFENLSLNLREVLRKFGRDVGINLKAIRAYAQQLFLGLSLLRKCNLLHADLKPDNILVNEGRNLLKICDLGSASHISENPTAPYLVSRFYRAPEIILGIPYDYAIDVWSIGCTLFELYTGKILFTGRNNNGMLRAIMECRGRFPPKLLRRGTLAYQYFDEMLNFIGMEEDKLTGRTITKVVEVKAKPVKDLISRIMPKGSKRMGEEDRRELTSFVELLERCLDLRSDRRITPAEALRHPFILKGK